MPGYTIMHAMVEPPSEPNAPLVGSSTLHDATLETIAFDWPNGVLEIRLKVASGTVVLRASAVARFSCPRLHPWGPSSSVNEVRSALTADGHAVVEIEMQSGDVLAIEGGTFTIET
jgi:hypothetical protein